MTEKAILNRAIERMSADIDKAIYASAGAHVTPPAITPSTNPAASKQEWMGANPTFRTWRPHQGVLSLKAWKDVGWVTEDGRFIPEGDDRFMGGLHLNSYGDTLYVVPAEATKVGREYTTII